MQEKVVLTSDTIGSIIDGLAEKVYRDINDISRFAIVGVQTRGVEIARRVKGTIEKLSGTPIQFGILDITFYRDDLSVRGVLPQIKETRISFDIADMTILLVDDVIFTGRTTKAAIETLMSFGRPKVIRLFTLVDRGNRELPIQPDYCGLKLTTQGKDYIKVLFKEVDGVDDGVLLCSEN